MDSARLGTLAVHGAWAERPANEPATLPLYQSAAWAFRDLDEVDAALTPGSLLLVETISNPRMRVADLPALARTQGALLVVDNTLATPYHARPLDLGADLVVESLTKFLSGHHQVLLEGLVGPGAPAGGGGAGGPGSQPLGVLAGG